MASKVETSSIRSDDNRFLFLFVRREDGVYLLYKIDFVNCLEKKDPEEEVALSPLIVFSKKCLATDCYFAFVFLKPYFYFIGGDNKIFTIRKSQLLKIDPSEKKRGSRLLKPLDTRMHGNKLDPLAFTYENNLYVISKGYFSLIYPIDESFFEFEVYSPKTKSWTDLGDKPMRHCGITSHLVFHDIVYFTTTSHVVVSFDLVNQLWLTMFDPYGLLARYPEYSVFPRSTFDSDIQIIGNTVFGGIFNTPASFSDICASPTLIPSDDMFLRPSLTHDRSFHDHIYAITRLTRRRLTTLSKSLVTINSEERIICVIGYGNDPYDKLANYAVLTFFKVHDGSHQGDIIHEPEEQENGKEFVRRFHWINKFDYATDEQGDHVNFFRADFITSTLMPIYTNKQATPGVIYNSVLA
ncbi:hypothetical protein AgCh_003165 [Apium graveolens]